MKGYHQGETYYRDADYLVCETNKKSVKEEKVSEVKERTTVNKHLRMLADNYLAATKSLTSQKLRIDAVKRGVDEVDEVTWISYLLWEERLTGHKDLLVGEMGGILDYHPCWPFLQSISGIAEAVGGTLLGLWGDIEKYPLISKFTRASGWGLGPYYISEETGQVVSPVAGWKWVRKNGKKERVWVEPEQPEDTFIDHRVDKPIRGWLLPFNKVLKSRLWHAFTQFLRADGKAKADGRPRHPHVAIYYEYKDIYAARPLKGPSLCPIHSVPHLKGGKVVKCQTGKHIDNAARRKAITIFLQHVWEYWRLAKGLPIRATYVEEKLGYVMRYPIRNFTNIPIPAETRPWSKEDEEAATGGKYDWIE